MMKFAALLLLLSSIAPLVAHAEFLPRNVQADPTLSVVVFEDPYLTFLPRTDNRTLGAIAVDFPLFGFSEDAIYAFVGIEATLRNKGVSFASESMDLRLGAKWVHAFDPKLTLSIGLSHTSGHVVDDVLEKSLIPFNVGIDGIPVRLVFNSFENFRLGLHALVPIDSDPATRYLIPGLFTEFYFSSSKTKEGWMLGSDLYLPENPELPLSTVTEVAYRYRQSSVMLGFHSGADVRLKHQLFLKSQLNFGFAGVRFEI